MSIFTNTKLRQLFNECNDEIFNGELPSDITVEWSKRMTRIAGSFSWRKNRATKKIVKRRIGLSVPYHEKYMDEIKDTLVHEMIHLKYPGDGHGSKFVKEMERINREFGMDLTVFSTGRAVEIKYECDNCGRTFTRSKKLNSSHRCGACGLEKGTLTLISKE